MITLQPSYLRCAVITVGLILLVVGLGYAQGNVPIDPTLLVPILLAPNIVWVMFVPRSLEYSEQELRVRSWVRAGRLYSWPTLEYFGTRYGVFVLRFQASFLEQILPYAYRSPEWAQFETFVRQRYPERDLKW